MKSKLILIITIFFLVCSCSLVVANNEITVFILDSEVDYQFVKERTMPLTGEITHGSAVGRIIYQEAPEINLLSYNVDTEYGLDKELYFAGLDKILAYKQKNPQQKVIVNISLSFANQDNRHHKLINRLKQQGVLVVAAAGNNSSDQLIYPAGFKEVVAVGNAKESGKAPSSNYGTFIDLCAPGNVKYISRLYFLEGVQTKTFRAVGTSFSAPRVVGLLAKILVKDSSISINQGLDLIINQTRPIDDKKYNQGQLGAGVIDVDSTLAQIDGFYYFKKLGPGLVWGGLLFVLFLLGFKRYRLAVIFLALLIILVIFPLVIIIQETLLANLNLIKAGLIKFDFLEITILLLGPSIVWLLTSWKKRFLTFHYLALFILSIVGLNFISDKFIDFQVYLLTLIIGWSLFLILLERRLIYKVQINKSIFKLVKLVNSSSRDVSSKAENKICNNDFSLRLMLEALEKEKSDLATSQKLLFSQSDDLINKLIEVLKNSDQSLQELIIKLLSSLDKDKVIIRIEHELLNDEQNSAVLLRLVENLGQQANELSYIVKEILLSNSNMWLRYQALKTLVAIYPRINKLKSFIKDLTTDKQELVRLEAAKILSDLNDGIK